MTNSKSIFQLADEFSKLNSSNNTIDLSGFVTPPSSFSVTMEIVNKAVNIVRSMNERNAEQAIILAQGEEIQRLNQYIDALKTDIEFKSAYMFERTACKLYDNAEEREQCLSGRNAELAKELIEAKASNEKLMRKCKNLNDEISRIKDSIKAVWETC